ncbi:hypothetical protein ES703_84887 [subsurface metagenome]
MKKLWEIVVSDKVAADIPKKIVQVLKPTLSVGRPQKCLFCGVDTTWTLNTKPVCPMCSVRYSFLGEQWLLDPCEVCGKQGEWATDAPQHFLCYQHRDAWFKWKTPELEFIDSKKEQEKWRQAWEEGWSRFVAFMKEKVSV